MIPLTFDAMVFLRMCLRASKIFSIWAENARPRPVLVGVFLDRHVQAIRLGVAMFDHCVGNRTCQLALLVDRAPFEHMHEHDWHFSSPRCSISPVVPTGFPCGTFKV